MQRVNGVPTNYKAINCTDYINGPYWDGYSEAERQSAIGELEHEY